MTILNDIKTFLVAQNAIESGETFFNFDESTTAESRVILTLKPAEYNDTGGKVKVEISVKNLLMSIAESTSQSIYSLLCPPKNYEKPMILNGTLMLIKSETQPYYKEKDKTGRHVFVFEINIIYSR